MPHAIACFERAIALDPGYAEPLAWLSDSYRLMGVFGLSPSSEVMPKSKELAERALAIDGEMAEAWAALGAVFELYDRDYPKSDAYYARALSIDPRHSRARSQRALWRAIRGAIPVDHAVTEVRQALQDDPLNSWVGGMYSYILGIAGRYEDSITEAHRSLELDPDSFFAHWNVMRSLAWGGHYERAIAEAPALFALSGRHHWALGLLGWTYGRAGDAMRARACYDELEARSRHEFVGASWLAVLASASGLDEEAMRWAERGVAERDPLMVWARSLQFWESIRAHPRFAEVVRDVWD
jgi:tetratricopeptide (TPR) repeat protein